MNGSCLLNKHHPTKDQRVSYAYTLRRRRRKKIVDLRNGPNSSTCSALVLPAPTYPFSTTCGIFRIPCCSGSLFLLKPCPLSWPGLTAYLTWSYPSTGKYRGRVGAVAAFPTNIKHNQHKSTLARRTSSPVTRSPHRVFFSADLLYSRVFAELRADFRSYRRSREKTEMIFVEKSGVSYIYCEVYLEKSREMCPWSTRMSLDIVQVPVETILRKGRAAEEVEKVITDFCTK
ncbi:unnamed protein product [Nesidiocoris tenuis]|uniref:Uncharacterized protein n=1 Tax=Nesidiocoris tenuis TaxID=355587 RepID=A0A6H5FXL5_9HEMI|nr:unnamed protein product [Nesidiocoris tenuis]